MAPIDQSKIQEAKRIVKEKIKEWYENIRCLNLEDIEPNIFLAGALGITDPKEFIGFYVRQHVERSIVTSFGFLIEKVASIIGDNVKLIRRTGKDLEITRNGQTYYIEVKSGPISCNKDMIENISKKQLEIKQEENVIVCLGLLYGKKENVFGIIK